MKSKSILSAGVAGWLLLSATAASAGPAKVGPIDPATGYPLWYEDANGLTLQLCDQVDDNLTCLIAPTEVPNPAAPLTVNVNDAGPHNFGHEAFYWAAGALLDTPYGRAGLTLALEAAFFPEEIARKNEIVFGRVRVVMDVKNPAAGTTATYVVTHPYGEETFVVEHEPSSDPRKPAPATVKIFWTEDIGADVARGFDGALKSRIGPFLTPIVDALDGCPPPQAGFIGDSNSECRVTGSPNGNNLFRIAGPGINLQTERFTITGKVATKFGVGVTRATYTRGPWDPGLEIFAETHTSNPPQNIVAIHAGTSYPLVTDGTGKYYTVVAGDFAPGTKVDVVNLSDPNLGADTATRNQGFTDRVTIVEQYYFRDTQIMEIVAASSDEVSGATLLAYDEDGKPLGGIDGVTNKLTAGAEGLMLLIPLPVPPREITVVSSLGGRVSAIADVGLCSRAGNSQQCTPPRK